MGSEEDIILATLADSALSRVARYRRIEPYIKTIKWISVFVMGLWLILKLMLRYPIPWDIDWVVIPLSLIALFLANSYGQPLFPEF